MKYLLLTLISFNIFAENLKIMTWNIFMIPKPFNFTSQTERTDLIAEKLKNIDSDVLFFQESFTRYSRRHIVETLKHEFPYHTRLKSSGKFYQFLNSGVFVLSKFPIKTLAEVFYNECSNTDCFASKGFIFLEMTLPSGKKIQIGSTHLQAWDKPKNIKTRVSQLNQIKSTLEKFKISGVPQILAGDFNIDRNNSEIQNLENILDLKISRLPTNLDFTNGFQVNCYHTPGKGDNPEWIDYILVKPNSSEAHIRELHVKPIAASMDGEVCNLSDHYALQGIVSI